MEGSVTRKQAVLILILNALVSAMITAGALLLFVVPALREQSPLAPARAVGATAEGASAQAVALASPTPILHTVAAGDTISGLAMKYDVPAADIIAANQLQNPNFLQVGVQLVIPVGGVPNATATFTPRPTATDTPIPFEPPSADMTATAATAAGVTPIALDTPLPYSGDLKVEITAILAPGEAEQEAVELTNAGDRLADMQGWTLRDVEGNVYTFPNVRLWAGGIVTLYTRAGEDGSPPFTFYWGRAEAVWSPGEIATLQDTAGKTMATFMVGR